MVGGWSREGALSTDIKNDGLIGMRLLSLNAGKRVSLGAHTAQ